VDCCEGDKSPSGCMEGGYNTGKEEGNLHLVVK
jgi:hypothetical protein